MRYDYGGPMPLNTLTHLRLSQSRRQEAAQMARGGFSTHVVYVVGKPRLGVESTGRLDTNDYDLLHLFV